MRARAMALLLLAGCDGGPLCLTDTFDRDGVDTARWSVNLPAQVTASSGRLELALPAGVDSHPKVTTYRAIDFTGRSATVDVARYLRAGDTTQSVLAVQVDDANELLIVASAGALSYQVKSPGGSSMGPTRDPGGAVDGWRIAHDVASDMIRFETRTAGAWQIRYELKTPAGLGLGAMRILLGADSGPTGASSPDVAAFGNLHVSEAACTSGAGDDEHLGPYGPP